jgi:hypothetical protein
MMLVKKKNGQLRRDSENQTGDSGERGNGGEDEEAVASNLRNEDLYKV